MLMAPLAPLMPAPFTPMQTASGQETREYEDASTGLPTTSLWVSRPGFFDLNDDGSGDLTILGPRKGPGDKSLHVYSWGGSSWSDVSATEGTNSVPHSSYGGYTFGDIDNDGDWDVGVGSHGDQSLEAYLQLPGNAWTGSSQGLQGAEDAWSVDLGDLNSDGNLDMAVGGFWERDVAAYTGDGNGNWVSASEGLNRARTKQEVRFFDFNNDGDLDILAGIGDCADSGDYIYVYQGDGTGVWEDASTGLPQSGLGVPVSHGDIDNDGLPDLALSHSSYGTRVYRGDGAGNWENSSVGLPQSQSYSGIHLADLNNDKYDDLVTLMASDPGVVHLYLADGDGQWELADTITMEGNAKGWRVWAGDFDHNGYRDIVAGFGTEEEYGSIRVWREASEPTELQATLTYPDGGEYLKSGSVQFIRWLSAVPSGAGTRTVKLELSTSGSNGPWSLIGEDLPDSGLYQWTVPDEQSGNAYLRIAVEESGGDSATDTSDGAFGIDEAPTANHDPTLEVLKPAQAREAADDAYTIEWLAEDEDENDLTIALYHDEDDDPDNGMTLIADELENTGSYTWDCSDMENGVYHIRGSVDDHAGGSASHYAAGTVRVKHPPPNSDPTVEVTRPDEETEAETVDGEFTIQWEASDDDGDELTITLHYDEDTNVDNGMELIEQDLANSGSHL